MSEFNSRKYIRKIHDTKKDSYTCVMVRCVMKKARKHIHGWMSELCHMCRYLMKISSSFSTKLYSKLLIPLRLALTTVLQPQDRWMDEEEDTNVCTHTPCVRLGGDTDGHILYMHAIV